jgi:hypothetical protein
MQNGYDPYTLSVPKNDCDVDVNYVVDHCLEIQLLNLVWNTVCQNRTHRETQKGRYILLFKIVNSPEHNLVTTHRDFNAAKRVPFGLFISNLKKHHHKTLRVCAEDYIQQNFNSKTNFKCAQTLQKALEDGSWKRMEHIMTSASEKIVLAIRHYVKTHNAPESEIYKDFADVLEHLVSSLMYTSQQFHRHTS